MYNYYCIKLYKLNVKKNSVSKNIKKIREKAGLTQEALARKADISCNTIIKLETGGIKDPRMSTLVKEASALGVSIDRLVRKQVVCGGIYIEGIHGNERVF